MIVGLSACSSDSGPTRPPPTPVPWTGEIQIVDQDGVGVPGLLVQVTHATQDLPSKSQNAAGVASDVVEGFTDHDGIARPEETFEVGLLWIHQLRVSTAGGELLHQDTLVTTEQESLGEIDVLGHRFRLDLAVEFQISAEQDSAAVQTILGTWQTAFVDDEISYGRRLSYHEDGTFDGIHLVDSQSHPYDHLRFRRRAAEAQHAFRREWYIHDDARDSGRDSPTVGKTVGRP
jgi:hypothetical protein